MLYHQRMANAEVGAPQRLGHPGMLAGESLDVGLVEHHPLGRDAGIGGQALSLLERIDEVPYLRLRGAKACAERLRLHREQALLCRRLTTIALDAPLTGHDAHFARDRPDAAQLATLCEALRFGPMTRRRLRAAAGLDDPAY